MKAGRLVLAIALLCFFVVSSTAALASKGRSSAVPSGVLSAEFAGHGPEIPALRTRYSRTFEGVQGATDLVLYSRPVSFQDGGGRWRLIDDSLTKSAGSYVNRADAFKVSLPAQLSSAMAGAVSLTHGRFGVAFSLAGSNARASVQGATATYVNALPQADVRLTATSSGLEEFLTLKGRGAPESFSYRLMTKGGLRPKLRRSGDVALVDDKGVAHLTIPAPVARDARSRRGPARFTLAPDGSHWQLTVTVDHAWLSSSRRAFPVTVDPTTTTITEVQTCTLKASAPETSFCAGGEVTTRAENGVDQERGLLEFSAAALSQIPTDSEIGAALLKTNLSECHETTAATIYSVKATWNSTATWNKPIAGGAEWPGGSPYDTTTSVPAEIKSCPTPGKLQADVTPLVREWVANKYGGFYGLGFSNPHFEQFSGNFRIATQTVHPELLITYMPTTGERSQFRYDSWQLDDKMRLSVNVGTGDLHLLSEDFALPGPGISISENHMYDSRRMGTPVDLSLGWKFSVGRETICMLCSQSAEIAGARVGAYWDAPDGSVVGLDGTAKMPNGETGNAFSDGVDAEYARGSAHYLVYNATGLKFVDEFSKPEVTYEARNTAAGKTPAAPVRFRESATSTCPTAGPTFTIRDWTEAVALTLHTNCTGSGQVTKMEDATGREWLYAYDGSGRLHTYTDPEKRVTSYEYNANNLLSKITTPAGNITEIAYDPALLGRVLSITRKNSTGEVLAKTSYSYSQSLQSGPCQSREFNTTETDPVGRVWQYCFDTNHRMTHFIDPNGHDRDSTTYGAFSAVHTLQPATGQSGNPYSLTIDPSTGVTTAASEPTGAQTTTSYDTEHNPYKPTLTTDAQGSQMKMSYDTGGRLLSAEALRQGNGNQPEQLHLTWAGELLEKSVLGKSPSQQTTEYRYDPRGNLTEILPPAEGATKPIGNTKMTYDTLDRVATRIDGAGHEAVYHYDKLDRVKEITYSDGSAIKYVYDADGNLKETISPSGATINSYDGLDRLTSTTFGTTTVTEDYYADSQPKDVIDAGGTVTYTYNKDGQLATVSDPATRLLKYKTTKELAVIAFHWDTDQAGGFPHGNLTEIGYPIGAAGETKENLTTTYSYDANDRVATILSTAKAKNLQSWKYSYINTANGNKPTDLRQFIEGPASQQTTYTYDYLNRLTSAQTTDPTKFTLGRNYTYCYDSCGSGHPTSEEGFSNILQQTTQIGEGAPTTADYHYNNSNELTSDTAGSFSYDEAGNRTSAPSYSMKFNVRDQLTEYTLTGAFPQALSYQDATNTLLSTDGIAQLENSPLGVIADNQTTLKTITYFSRTPEGMLLDSRGASGRNVQYYVADDKESVTRTAKENGKAEQANPIRYVPFGSPIEEGAIPTFGFDGGYQNFTTEVHLSSDLIHLGERYYDPSTGTWTQPDPENDPQALLQGNAFVFSNDDPINESDPSGREAMAETVADMYLKGVQWCYHHPWTTAHSHTAQVVCRWYAGEYLYWKKRSKDGVISQCISGAVEGAVAGLVGGETFGVAIKAAGTGSAVGCVMGILKLL